MTKIAILNSTSIGVLICRDARKCEISLQAAFMNRQIISHKSQRNCKRIQAPAYWIHTKFTWIPFFSAISWFCTQPESGMAFFKGEISENSSSDSEAHTILGETFRLMRTQGIQHTHSHRHAHSNLPDLQGKGLQVEDKIYVKSPTLKITWY